MCEATAGPGFCQREEAVFGPIPQLSDARTSADKLNERVVSGSEQDWKRGDRVALNAQTSFNQPAGRSVVACF